MSQDDEPREGHDDSDVYELDLDEAEDSVDDVTREALEAVEGRKGGGGESAETTIAALQAEIEDLRDRSIRTLADFENFRRRSERERDDLRRFALAEAVRDYLAVVDNLERALSAGGTVDDLKAGVEMTLRQFKDVLRQQGVVAVEAAGQPFDPNLHEAVARDEDPAVTVPTVTAELQRGYLLNGRLLRPAMVKVAMPVAGGEG